MTTLRKSEKVLAVLVLAAGALWLTEPTHSLMHLARGIALVLAVILGIAVTTSRLIGLGRRIARAMLWRVRHRMVGVFFFVGVLPVTLSLLLLLFGALFLFGPLTAYVLTAELEQIGGQMDEAATLLAWQVRDTSPAALRSLLEDFRRSAEPNLPGLIIHAEYGGSPVAAPESRLRAGIPPNLGEARGMVQSGSEMLLAVGRETSQPPGRLMLAVPLTANLIQAAMPGLGVVEYRLGSSAGGPDGTGRASLVPVVRIETSPPGEGPRPPWHPSSWMIRWPHQSQVLNLDTSEMETRTFELRTRPYELWSKIFSALPEFSLGLFTFLGYGLAGSFLVSVFVSGLVAISLSRTLTRAVHDLQVGTRRVNEGDFGYRIPVSGHDQISDLSRSFNAMASSLETLLEESRQKQQLEAELDVARTVQGRLLPVKPPAADGIEILGACRPARSVSGDLYDYLDLGGRHLAIALGDVCGKGISAALLMASLHSIIRAQCTQIRTGDATALQASAARLVRQANKQLHASTASNKFATLFFGILDTASGNLAYVNAGHLPPLLLRNGSVRRLDVTGPIVGAFPGAEFGASTLTIQPGDGLLAYTDGLTEPEDGSGEAFGEERLRRAVTGRKHLPLRSIIDGTIDEAVAWTGQPTLQDDMTMLVLRMG